MYLKQKRHLIKKKYRKKRQTLQIIGTLFNAIIRENTVLFSRKLSQNYLTAKSRTSVRKAD